MPSREHAGRRRDFYLERVDKTLSGVELDALDLRKGMLDALDAARWAAGADGRDDRIAELLQWAGQLGVALLESIRGRALPVPYRGDLITVPIGLPLEGFHAGQWAETLFAATAAQDAPSAVRLSRVQVDAFVPGGPPGQTELATAVAAIWTGDGTIGPHVVAALERTSPDDLPAGVVDAALDLVVPQAAVLNAIAGGGDWNGELQDAADRFVSHWAGSEPEGFLSIELSALAVLGRLLTGQGPVTHAVLPGAVVSRPARVILACPVCAEPFNREQHVCAWCGTDLTADAPLELQLADWLGARRKPCPACRSLVHPQALRCWSCGERRSPG